MEVQFRNIAKVFIPSLLIFYSLCSKGFIKVGPYHETYANDDYMLDIYFEINPRGVLRDEESESLRFTGYFATAGGEEAISGRLLRNRGETAYLFDGQGGRFEAHFLNQVGLCEPVLAFRWKKRGGEIATGRLRGAFCI